MVSSKAFKGGFSPVWSVLWYSVCLQSEGDYIRLFALFNGAFHDLQSGAWFDTQMHSRNILSNLYPSMQKHSQNASMRSRAIAERSISMRAHTDAQRAQNVRRDVRTSKWDDSVPRGAEPPQSCTDKSGLPRRGKGSEPILCMGLEVGGGRCGKAKPKSKLHHIIYTLLHTHLIFLPYRGNSSYKQKVQDFTIFLLTNDKTPAIMYIESNERRLTHVHY